MINNHIAILYAGASTVPVKEILPKEIVERTVFFSDLTLTEMIEEEARRDTSVIIEREGQSLRSMSSGERKMALLNYLISLAPAFLCIEHFYEHLDPVNHKRSAALLSDISGKIKIIQIVRKEKELLPFIKQFFVLNEELKLELYTGEPVSYLNNKENKLPDFSIPGTTTQYKYDYTTFVKLTDVSVNFLELQVLKNISLEIKLGECWQLIGENGTGKSTLLSMITGDSPKAYGQNIVLFDKLKGTEENIWEIKQKIGYFNPTVTELFNRGHTALQIVLSGFYDSIGLYTKPSDIHIELAYEWLELIGMRQLYKVPFVSLSLAQQRMVLIARAMVKHPPLLILDEPTSGVPQEGVSLIVALINKIAKETMTTIIFVSHAVENGLSPGKIYKLTKDKAGSTGEVL